MSSATLSSRTNSYLHQLNANPVLVSLVDGKAAPPSIFSGLAVPGEAEADQDYFPKPPQRYYGFLDRHQSDDCCTFCLSKNHCYLTCPEPQRQITPWKLDQDRSNRPTSAFHDSIICLNCLQPGHSNCADYHPADGLWNDEDAREKFMEYWHSQVFSLEEYAAQKNTPPWQTAACVTDIEDVDDDDDVKIMRFNETPRESQIESIKLSTSQNETEFVWIGPPHNK